METLHSDPYARLLPRSAIPALLHERKACGLSAEAAPIDGSCQPPSNLRNLPHLRNLRFYRTSTWSAI